MDTMNQQRRPPQKDRISGPQGPAHRAGGSRAPVEAGFRIADILAAAQQKQVKR